MKHFEYRAQYDRGGAISGTIEAADTDVALTQLSAMGLQNVELHEASGPPTRHRIGRDDFIFFNEQLASLAGAGICLDAGLRQLAKDIRSKPLRRVLSGVADDIEHGMPLDQAMSKRADQMPPLYSRVVRAGVENGRLAGTLFNLSHHLRLVAGTRRLIVDALAYPTIVLLPAAALLAAITTLLVPQLDELYRDFDVNLPGLTLALLGFSRAAPPILLAGAVAVILLIAVVWLTRAAHATRAAYERAILAIPLVGRLMRDSIRARFCRGMAFSVESGIPLPEGLRLAADTTASAVAAREAHDIAAGVERGGRVFDACKTTTIIPPMFGYVIDVSADRNNVSDALSQLAGAYEARAAQTQSLLRVWLGPLAVIAVGGMLGMCIIALFLPMVRMVESVSW